MQSSRTENRAVLGMRILHKGGSRGLFWEFESHAELQPSADHSFPEQPIPGPYPKHIYLFFTRTSGRALIPRTAPFFLLTLHTYIYSSQVLKEKMPITGKSTSWVSCLMGWFLLFCSAWHEFEFKDIIVWSEEYQSKSGGAEATDHGLHVLHHNGCSCCQVPHE